ncbi:hypothetical protein [Bradyrhizobium stylosanthis]|nr:hypothetical protein [Bradyrhizobium stylosanthis]
MKRLHVHMSVEDLSGTGENGARVANAKPAAQQSACCSPQAAPKPSSACC